MHLDRHQRNAAPPLFVEPLESRTHLDGAQSPVGFTPRQINNVYGFTKLTTGNFKAIFTTKLGAAQTIVIIAPNIDASLQADLDTFDAEFNLPTTTLNISTINTPDPSIVPESTETAMMVEWTHAFVPQATINVIQVDPTSKSDFLIAVDAAVAALKVNGGVVEIAPTFGETTSDKKDNSHFSNANTTNVSFIAPAQINLDTTNEYEFPATSPNVLAVGGTTLKLKGSQSVRLTETAWDQSGGGASEQFKRPNYQDNLPTAIKGLNARVGPDVSFLGNLDTGVAVFDSNVDSDDNPGGWFEAGGCQLGVAAWASIVSLANEARQFLGRNVLGSSLQSTIYNTGQIQPQDFFDITKGGPDGRNATKGFDLSTGWGSPIVNALMPALSGELSGNGTFSFNTIAEFDQPITNRAVLNFRGVTRFNVTTTKITLNMAVTDSTDGSATIVVTNPLKRVGKRGFKGTATVDVTLTDGTEATFNIRIHGLLYKFNHKTHGHGSYVAVDDNGNELLHNFQPVLQGTFRA